MEAVKGNGETVGSELSRQWTEILEKLEAMRPEHQGQYEELIELIRLLLEDQQGVNDLRARYLEAIPESSEREKRYQETVIAGSCASTLRASSKRNGPSRATRSAWSGSKRSGAAPRPSFVCSGPDHAASVRPSALSPKPTRTHWPHSRPGS